MHLEVGDYTMAESGIQEKLKETAKLARDVMGVT
jgi:hypothetical protein